MANFNYCIEKVLVNEGGYVNNKNDSGGETNFGISKRAYPDLDIKNLSREKAKEIYKRDYWDRIKGDDITDDEIAFEILDTCVNMGVRTGTKLVQFVLGAKTDGILGNKTLFLVNSADQELFISKFKLAKISRYMYIVKKNPKNKVFLAGWLNRVLGV